VTPPPTLDDEQRHAAALAALGAAPGVLRRLLDGYGPVEAWQAVARGRHGADPGGRYRRRAVPETLERVAAACERAGVSVAVLGGRGYPPVLASDRQAPAVLFSIGDVTAHEGKPRVAVVGTRSATPYGVGIAAQLGRDLARTGVVVVSGLAPGVDAAAHGGALGIDSGAPVVGVLGTSLDATANRSLTALRQAASARGAVLSEIAPGAHSARWWFSVRNRVMAALAHVVVVVECHHRGGSLDTVSEALARGVTVCAVPGSVRSPASAGTNRLLVDGAVPVRDAQDVLTAVELAIAARPEIAAPGRLPGADRPVAPGRGARPLGPAPSRVRRALDQDPATLEVVVRRSGLSLGEVSLALEQLAEAGLAVGEQGWWSRPRG